jgi:hypothetical protein
MLKKLPHLLSTKLSKQRISSLTNLKGKFFAYINLFFNLFYYCTPLVLFFWATAPQLHSTPDSLHYLAAAKSWASQGVFMNPDQSPYIAWTPLYPILIGIAYSLIGLNWVKIIHIISIIIILYNSKKLAKKVFNHHLFLYFYLLQIVFSPYLLLCSVFIWSEITFIALLLLLLNHLLNGIKNYKDLTILLIYLNLLCLQRNTGILIVIAVAFTICLGYSKMYLPKNLLFRSQKYLKLNNWLSAFYILLLGSSAFVIWQIRCEILFTQSTHFTQNIFDFPLQEVLHWAVYRLGSWFIPLQFSWIAHLFVLLLVLSLFVYQCFHWKAIDTKVKVLWVLSICYLCIFIALLRNLNMDGDRYFSPIHALAMLVISYYLEKLYQSIQTLRLRIFFTVLLLIWLCYPIMRTVKNALFWHNIV